MLNIKTNMINMQHYMKIWYDFSDHKYYNIIHPVNDHYPDYLVDYDV